MGKSLNDFISQTKKGLANTSHFDVEFSKPKVINSQRYTQQEMERVLMFCETAQLPGYSYFTTPIRTFGEPTEIPYERAFTPATLTFYVDKDLLIKSFFDEWLAGIQNPYTRQFNFYNDYTVNLSVLVYDKANNKKYKMILYEAYPKEIGQIELSNSSREVMRVSVTFVYRYWTTEMMQNLGGDGGFFGNRTLLDSVFEVPNKIWNTYVNLGDATRGLLKG